MHPQNSSANISVILRCQGKEEWDQFKANEDMFGVQTTYDENLYTTRLDKGTISE
jgi:PAB1-binding protein PBP1